YSDDEAINRVLRSQYERALEDTRRDQGPARRMRMERAAREEVAAAVAASPNHTLTPDELSRIQIRLQRQMDDEMDQAAQQQAQVNMTALRRAYDENPNYPASDTLQNVIAQDMSFDEQRRARDLVRQGGYLTPYQELDYATRGAGTDEDALRRA